MKLILIHLIIITIMTTSIRAYLHMKIAEEEAAIMLTTIWVLALKQLIKYL